MSHNSIANQQFAALQNPHYRRFWLGSLASVGAVQLLMLAQGWLVFELTGSPLDLGILGAAASVPTIIVTLFGSVLADRLDKRKVIAVSSYILAALLLLLAALDYTGLITAWQVFVIAGLMALVGGFDWPARQAIFPSFIEPEQMLSAVALNAILWQGTRMILPAIGGLLIVLTDTAFVFLLSALGFLVMIWALHTLPATPGKSPTASSMSNFIEGIQFIIKHRIFIVLILLTWIMMFFGTATIQLMPAFAALLDAGGSGYGILMSASGVGSVAGTLLVSTIPKPKRLGWLMLGSLILTALMLYCFSLSTGLLITMPGAFYLALLCIALVALFSSVYLISSMTVLQLQVPDSLRGRVMGIHGITFSFIALGGLFGGSVAAMFSLPVAVATGASIILLAVIVVLVTQPEIRQYTDQD